MLQKNLGQNLGGHPRDISQKRNFWDRKGIIKQDPQNEERCSHTTVPPSAMMTLAMELQVSNRGKAAKIYKQAKKKASNESDFDSTSKLPGLWVVPKEVKNSPPTNRPGTASRLQPSLNNIDFVFRPGSRSPDHNQSSKIQGTGDIAPEERRFIENITVADLVGSEDRVENYLDECPDQKNYHTVDRQSHLSTSTKTSMPHDEKQNLCLNEQVDEGCSDEKLITSGSNHKALESSSQCTYGLPPTSKTNTVNTLTSNDCQTIHCARSMSRRGQKNMPSPSVDDLRSRTNHTKNALVPASANVETYDEQSKVSLRQLQLQPAGHSSCRESSVFEETEKQVVYGKSLTPDVSSGGKDTFTPISAFQQGDLHAVGCSRKRSLSQTGSKWEACDNDRSLTPDSPCTASQSGGVTPPLLTSSPLSSSSLFSLSSFGSVSPTSIGLSLASSVALCSSAVPSSVNSFDRIGRDEENRRTSENEKETATYTEERNVTNAEANISMSCLATSKSSEDVVTASSRAIINSQTSCAVVNSSRTDECCRYGRTASASGSATHSHNTSLDANLENKTSSCSAERPDCAERAGTAKLGSANRKIICQFSDEIPSNSESRKQSTVPGKGIVISKAVFPDQKDRTLASPLLQIRNKKTRPLCKLCGQPAMEDGASLLICCWCCRKKPVAPPRRDSRRFSKKFRCAEQQADDPNVEFPSEPRRSVQIFELESLPSAQSSSLSSLTTTRSAQVAPATGQEQCVEARFTCDDQHPWSAKQPNFVSKTENSRSQLAAATMQGDVSSSAGAPRCRIILDPSRKANSGNSVIVTNFISESDVAATNNSTCGVSKAKEAKTPLWKAGSVNETHGEQRTAASESQRAVVNGSKITLVKPSVGNKRSESDQRPQEGSLPKQLSTVKRNEQRGLVDEVLRAIDESIATRPQNVTQQKPDAASVISNNALSQKIDLDIKSEDAVISEKIQPSSGHVYYQSQKAFDKIPNTCLKTGCGVDDVSPSVVATSNTVGKLTNESQLSCSDTLSAGLANSNQQIEQGSQPASIDTPVTSVVSASPRSTATKVQKKQDNAIKKRSALQKLSPNAQDASYSQRAETASTTSIPHSASPSVYSSSFTFTLCSPNLNSSSQSATVNEATPSTKIPVISQSSVVAQESNMQPVQFQSSPDYKRWQTQSPNLPQPAIYPAVNPLYGQEPKKVEMKIDPPPPSGRHFKKQLDHTKPQVVCVSADKCKGPNQKVYEKVCINYSKEGLRRIPAKQEQQREDSQLDASCKMVVPPHTTEDDEEFSGVVEPPTMKVKDIRAMFKRGPDYQDYAKPRKLSASSNNPATRKSSSGRPSARSSQSDGDFVDEIKSSNTEVAKQVMGLFKGALEIEKELEVFEEETLRMQQELTNNSGPNTNASPPSGIGHLGVSVTTSNDSEADSYVPPKSPGKLSTTWPPSAPEHVAVPPPSDIKSSVARIKTESQEVESFDESLDRFYDVLSDLTSS